MMLSSAAAFVLLTVIIGNVGADCPKVEQVPIDEAWFFKQGTTGFFSIRATGFAVPTVPAKEPEQQELAAALAASVEPFKGTKKSCWISSMVNGVQLAPDHQYKCTYNEANQYGCELDDNTGVVKRMNEMTIKYPDKIFMTVVATDNSTYVAINICQDGTKPYWVVAATKRDATLPDADINKALGITDKDVEASKKNAIKSTRFYMKQGVCPLEGTLKDFLNPVKSGSNSDQKSALANPLSAFGL